MQKKVRYQYTSKYYRIWLRKKSALGEEEVFFSLVRVVQNNCHESNISSIQSCRKNLMSGQRVLPFSAQPFRWSELQKKTFSSFLEIVFYLERIFFFFGNSPLDWNPHKSSSVVSSLTFVLSLFAKSYYAILILRNPIVLYMHQIY